MTVSIYVERIITLNAQNIHRWLTHVCSRLRRGLLQRCRLLSPVRQTKLN